jgi:signal transduction histidine kinase
VIRFGSILQRLVAMHLAAVLAVAVALPVVLYWRLTVTVEALHNQDMRVKAEEIAGYLRREGQGEWELELPARLLHLYSANYDRYGFAVLTASGQVLFSNVGTLAYLFDAAPRQNRPNYFQRNQGNVRLFGASVPVVAEGERLWVQIWEDEAHRDVLIDDLVTDYPKRSWVIAPILLVLLGIDLLIFRNALHPLESASRRAQEIGPAHTELRLSEVGMPREVVPLVRAVNAALDRLERGYKAQRDFVADAAHELRTPLAVLRADVETLGRRQAADSLLSDIDTMTRIVNQLIDTAESETLDVRPDETADIQAVCAEVAAFMAPIALAEGKGIAVLGEGEPVWVKGNAGALFQVVRNLVENAIRHTPEGTTVDIEAKAIGTITVCDAGPGIPVGERNLVFQRFWRGDRRRLGGAGLGLAIVKRIVEAHGGSIGISDAPAGGAMVTVMLCPAAVASLAEELTAEPVLAEAMGATGGRRKETGVFRVG